MTSPITEEIYKQVDLLPHDQKIKVLDFVRSLQSSQYFGVPGESLLKFAGLIPLDDLEQMEQAIQEGC